MNDEIFLRVLNTSHGDARHRRSALLRNQSTVMLGPS